MALPIIETPKFFTKLPSDGVEIAFRPFTVKEQKNLMIVQQGADDKTSMRVLVDCLTQCVENGENLKLATRPTIDFEWLFLQIRSKSIGEVIELSTKCGKCDTRFDFDLNISQIKVPPFPNEKVKISEDLSITFRHVSLKDLLSVKEPQDIVANCATAIHYKGEDYTEFSKEEFLKFIEPLTITEYALIDEFFKRTPSLTLKTERKCLKCGENCKIELQGIFNFFQ